MGNLLFIFCKGIIFAVVAALIYVIFVRKKQNYKKEYFLLTLIFILYVSVVFTITGAGTVYDMISRGLVLNSNQLNLDLFSHHIDWVGYIENVIMFMPLGFLLPFFVRKKHILIEIPVVIFYGLSFSLLIELSQLLNIRATDVDDLLMNTSGAVIGYLIYLILNLVWGLEKRIKIEKDGICRLGIYILITFLIRFFCYYEFGLAKLIYGF